MVRLVVRLVVHNATHGWLWSIPDLQCIQSWVVTMRQNWSFFHIFSYQTPEQGSEENKILTFETCSHITAPGVANHWFACLDISFPAARFLNANSWQNMFFLNGAFEMGLQHNQFNKSHKLRMVCSTQIETGTSSRQTTPQSCCWGGHIETDTANSRNAKFWLQYGDGTERFFSLIGNSFKIVGHRLWVCLSILNIFRLTFPLFNMSISLDNHLRAIFVTSSFESAFPAQFRGVLSRLPDAWTSLPPPFVPVKTGLRCCKLSNSCAN